MTDFTITDNAVPKAQITVSPFMDKVEILADWHKGKGDSAVNLILTLPKARELAMQILQCAAFVDERARAHERERLRGDVG